MSDHYNVRVFSDGSWLAQRRILQANGDYRTSTKQLKGQEQSPGLAKLAAHRAVREDKIRVARTLVEEFQL